ncbi:2-oxoacid:acceptor oxidoreductase family protein [Salinispira pacifica]|uniref:2-oxoglutarate oxidoreductase, gamma subunit n=1 Tax=Salinispira pacifica TaxID=1307761 RepID=V5WDY3_9SPIO|nr:2-oxoacid:acceptor oxidoreductase family protein [Salinispira pacifica]AHC13840.1 2-oxoglutarate oxidoreductase, gamma subunit [Salinispira pacifica]
MILSQKEIGSPVVDYPNSLIAMNRPSLLQFVDKVQSGGLIIVNSSVVQDKVERDDLRVIYVPATDMAKDAGLINAANMIVLTLYLLEKEVVDIETLKAVVPLSLKKKEYLDINLRLIEKAAEYHREYKD